MTARKAYLLLAALGFILPYMYFIRFLATYGLDLPLFFEQLTANDISTFFAVDLAIATVAFWAFAYWESRRRPIRFWWLSIAASVLVGLSFALPLFLYLREGAPIRVEQHEMNK